MFILPQREDLIMDYAEMLFALKMRELVTEQLNRELPHPMTELRRKQFIDDNFERYLAAALDEVQRIAYLIKDARKP